MHAHACTLFNGYSIFYKPFAVIAIETLIFSPDEKSRFGALDFSVLSSALANIFPVEQTGNLAPSL